LYAIYPAYALRPSLNNAAAFKSAARPLVMGNFAGNRRLRLMLPTTSVRHGVLCAPKRGHVLKDIQLQCNVGLSLPVMYVTNGIHYVRFGLMNDLPSGLQVPGSIMSIQHKWSLGSKAHRRMFWTRGFLPPHGYITAAHSDCPVCGGHGSAMRLTHDTITQVTAARCC
jgi:hypothetical protein